MFLTRNAPYVHSLCRSVEKISPGDLRGKDIYDRSIYLKGVRWSLLGEITIVYFAISESAEEEEEEEEAEEE